VRPNYTTQQSRLAGAVVTKHTQTLAVFKSKRDTTQRCQCTVSGRDVIELQHHSRTKIEFSQTGIGDEFLDGAAC